MSCLFQKNTILIGEKNSGFYKLLLNVDISGDESAECFPQKQGGIKNLQQKGSMWVA
jgi:hypothetical protein